MRFGLRMQSEREVSMYSCQGGFTGGSNANSSRGERGAMALSGSGVMALGVLAGEVDEVLVWSAAGNVDGLRMRKGSRRSRCRMICIFAFFFLLS